jgi:hypothetical protein
VFFSFKARKAEISGRFPKKQENSAKICFFRPLRFGQFGKLTKAVEPLFVCLRKKRKTF